MGSHVLSQAMLLDGCPLLKRPKSTSARNQLNSSSEPPFFRNRPDPFKVAANLTCSSSTLILLKCLQESSVSLRRNFQNTHKISKHGSETAAQTAAPVGCPNRCAAPPICLQQPKSVFSAGNHSPRNITLTIAKEFKILQTSLTMLK